LLAGAVAESLTALGTCRICCTNDFLGLPETKVLLLLIAAESGGNDNSGAMDKLETAFRSHMQLFFSTIAAHRQVKAGKRFDCPANPNLDLRTIAGAFAPLLKTWFEGALKVSRAKQQRLRPATAPPPPDGGLTTTCFGSSLPFLVRVHQPPQEAALEELVATRVKDPQHDAQLQAIIDAMCA
jgi:hypothetical protein